jgi:hypothetical protein
MFDVVILLDLKSMQRDLACAFLPVDLDENKRVYVYMQMGFAHYSKNGKKMCLTLKKYTLWATAEY